MKVFVFDRVEDLTSNWHSSGGVVVFAKDLKSAKELFNQSGEGVSGALDNLKPDVEYEVVGAEARVFVFPDAGCC